jgi:quercetin dioxygenase-like cupin family protein
MFKPSVWLVLFAIVLTVSEGRPADQKKADKLDVVPPTGKIIITHPIDYRVLSAPWGKLTWFASKEIGNSTTMTVGQALIKPGCESPRHFHPNCDEVLHVIQGTILHSTDTGKQVRLSVGDTISIPKGIVHGAKNIGKEDAILFLSFSSAERQAINEKK